MPARADALEDAARILDLNREAMELYESLEFDLALRTLDDALALVEQSNLQQHLVAAKTNGNRALVLASAFADEAGAIEAYKAALAIQPKFKPSSRAPREAQDAFRKAADQIAVPNPDQAPAQQPEAPVAAVRAPRSDAPVLRCPMAGEVDAGEKVTLRCVTQSGFRPATVLLHYRPRGASAFVSKRMEPKDKGSGKVMWSAVIPGDAVRGKWLPFFFEAQDASGTPLVRAGYDESPNILTIRGAQAAVEPSAKVARLPRNRRPTPTNDENPLEKQRDDQDPSAALEGRFFVGLALGSGLGYAAADSVEAYSEYVTEFSPGFAGPGLGHVLPEVGYFFSDSFAVSLAARLQIFSKPNDFAASGAVSALARGTFFAGGSGDSLRPYVSALLGGGEGFRLLVDVTREDGTPLTDTVRGGPLLAGAGVGLAWSFSEAFSWVVETNLLVGAPDISLALDINTGLRFLL